MRDGYEKHIASSASMFHIFQLRQEGHVLSRQKHNVQFHCFSSSKNWVVGIKTAQRSITVIDAQDLAVFELDFRF